MATTTLNTLCISNYLQILQSMSHVKEYKFTTGVMVSVFIGIISSIPRYVIASKHIDFADALLFFITGFMVTILSWYTNFHLLNFKSGTDHKTIKLWSRIYLISFSVLISLITGFLFAVAIYHFSEPDTYYLDQYKTFGRLWLWATFRCELINGFIIIIKYTIDIAEEKQEVLLKNEVLLNENILARFEALKQQINPHFLFNSLNSLKSLIKADPQQSETFVMRLSDVYRYLLQHGQQQTVTLSEELEFIKSYLFLLESRFGESLKFSINIPDRYLSTFIPPVSLQLLIENAIKHNIVSSGRPLAIHVFIQDSSIAVVNNLQLKRSFEKSTGTGLGSISTRYRLLTGMEIEVKEKQGTFIVLLPIIQS